MSPSERIENMISEKEDNSKNEQQIQNEIMKRKFRRRSLSPMMRVQSMFEDSDKVSDKKNSDDKDIKK